MDFLCVCGGEFSLACIFKRTLLEIGKCVPLPAALRPKFSSDTASVSKTAVTSSCPFTSQPKPVESACVQRNALSAV